MKNSFTITVLAILLTANSAQAQTCKPNIVQTAPDSRYQVVGSGAEVLDTQTKLIWQRCSLGQTWSGVTCAGSASVHTWVDALAKANSLGNGYRLPNINELGSLVERSCYDSAINEKFFPNTPSQLFWSSSSLSQEYGGSLTVYFGYGSLTTSPKGNNFPVRAVRTAP